MKPSSPSAVQTAGETPARGVAEPTIRDADKRLALLRSLGSCAELLPRFEADLAHVARLAALGELLAGIAHEIKQPLFSIQNYARASTVCLSRGAAIDCDRLLAWTRQIATEADRACAIMDRLRDFSRKTAPCPGQHDVSEVVREAVDLILPEARSRQIDIELEIDPKARTLYADRIQMQQVLVNLLKNACEAIVSSGAPAGRIIVRARRQNGLVHFSVTDTGNGLPVEPSKVFEPFFTTKPEGVGLGLALSRSIVESAHGRLWAEPATGCGAVFHFTVSSVPEATNGQ